MDIIYKKAAECGGLISGEHGIGYGKMDYLATFAGETSMRLMKGIKEVFDPKMILNPGKVCYSPVSYTHLDVYKRQAEGHGD